MQVRADLGGDRPEGATAALTRQDALAIGGGQHELGFCALVSRFGEREGEHLQGAGVALDGEDGAGRARQGRLTVAGGVPERVAGREVEGGDPGAGRHGDRVAAHDDVPFGEGVADRAVETQARAADQDVPAWKRHDRAATGCGEVGEGGEVGEPPRAGATVETNAPEDRVADGESHDVGVGVRHLRARLSGAAPDADDAVLVPDGERVVGDDTGGVEIASVALREGPELVAGEVEHHRRAPTGDRGPGPVRGDGDTGSPLAAIPVEDRPAATPGDVEHHHLVGNRLMLGHWGEIALENILNSSGLRKDQDYFLQFNGENQNENSSYSSFLIEKDQMNKIIKFNQ